MHWSPIKQVALFLLALLSLSAADQMSISCGGQSFPVQVRNYDEVANRTIIYDRTGTYEITYNSDGTIVEILYPNGIETLFTYDNQNRVTDVDHQTDEGITFLSYRYEYDEKDRQTMVQRLFDEEFTSTYYSYTPQGFLARVDYPNGDFEAYTYDEWGNRLTKESQDTFVDYEYDGEWLVRAGNTYYTYTEEGYLSEKTSPEDTEAFIFDGPFLVQTTNRSGALTYSYDDAGRRIRKSGDIDVELIPMPPEIFGLRDRVRIPFIVSDNCHYFCYGDGLLASSHPNQTRYYLYNHPDGSVAAVMEGDAVALLEFDPFGMPLSGDSPVGLNGEWFDFETGLYYLSNRYYDPEIGRYISPDFADDHPYIYCYNDPINYVDPLGLWGFGRAGTNQDMMGRGRPRGGKGGGGKTNSPPPPPPSRPGPFNPNPRTHKIKKKQKKQPPPPAPTPTPTTPSTPLPSSSQEVAKPSPASAPTPVKVEQNASPVLQKDQLQASPTQCDSRSSRSGSVRNVASTFAHEATEVVDELMVAPIAQLCEEVGDATKRFLPGAYPDQFVSSPQESRQQGMSAIHRAIDKLFQTDQTEQYTAEKKANESTAITLAMPPPPFGLGTKNASQKAATIAENATFSSFGQESHLNKRLTQHAQKRAIERGVSEFSIQDALANPLKIEEIKIDTLGRPSQRYIGHQAEVVLNPETEQIVSVNPTSTKKVQKLTKDCPQK